MPIIVTMPRKPYYKKIVLNDNPNGYWRLGEGSGTAVDETGNNNGTYSGDGFAVNGLIANDSNKAYDSNNDGIITISNDSLLELSFPFTLECWVQYTSQGEVLFEINGNSGYSVQTSNFNPGFFAIRSGDDGLFSDQAFNDGLIHHCIFIFRGTNDGDIYIDNVQHTGSGNLSSPSYSGAPPSFVIGARSPGVNQFEGIIDEVAIYDYELTPAQIQRHYERGVGI